MGMPCGYHYSCKVIINGKELNMLVDTGASFTILDRPAFDKIKNKYPLAQSATLASGFGGTGGYEVTIANSVKFNGIEFKKYGLAVMDISPIFGLYTQAGIDEKMDGVLGADILTHTQSVIDMSKYVIKSKRPLASVRRALRKQLRMVEPVFKNLKKYLKSKPNKDEQPIDISFPKNSVIDLPDGLPEAGRN